MLKNCLKTLVVFLIPLMSFAQIGSLSYEDFVHLSEKDQDKFVIKTMELIVRLENSHRNDPRTMHFTEEEEKKFTLFLKQLKGTLFIDEAHAFPGNYLADREWDRAAKDFTELITKDSNKKKCVYAGWISKAIGEGNNVTCAHPGYLMGDKSQRDNTPEGRAYIAPKNGSDCDQGGKKKIQCSPVIFGYKSIKDRTPFCVSAEDMARNSSFDCMQAALDLDTNNKGDSKEDRLNYIKSRLTDQKNRDVFKQVHEFNYKMCVCDSKPIPANFSNDYLKEIQLHQTCYGIMKMIGETAKMCSDTDQISSTDLSIFTKLDEYINAQVNKQHFGSNSKIPANTYGGWYSNYIKNLRKNKTTEYVRLCGGKVTPQPKPKDEPIFTCKGTCDIDKPEKGKMQCELSIKKDKEPDKKETKQFSTADYTDDGLKTQKKQLMIMPENSTKEINCEITAKTPVVVIPEPKPEPKPEPNKKKTYSCESICVKDEDVGKDGKICTLEVTIREEGVEFDKFDKIEGKPFTGVPKYKPDGEEKDIDCPEKKSEDPEVDTSKPTIKVTAIEGKETYKVNAVKENDKGWTFGWAIKGEKDVDVSGVSKDWEKKPEEEPKGFSNDGTATSEAPLAPDEFLQKRGKVDFKICGQLTKGNEVIEDCALIKKLEESKKPPVVGPQGNNMPAAPPQPIIRRSSDASAIGIR